MSQDNTFIPNQENYKPITPFQLFVKSNFPFIENTFEALDNYGLYCKIVEYLNDVIANENTVEDNVTALYNAFVSLNAYVSNYFDNLDVQEEINNKLDNMAESGELQFLLDRQYEALRTETQNSIALLRNETNQSIDEETSERMTQYNQLENQINSVASGSPTGVYATVEALTAANPNHSKIYVVLADGKWYYYNTTSNTWTAGGTYQGTSINKDTPAISELYDYINNFMQSNEDSITVTLNDSTDVYPRIYQPFKKGEYIKIDITDSSNILNPSGNLLVSEENYATTTGFRISNDNKIYQIHEDCKYLRFYISHSNVTEEGSISYTTSRYFFGDGVIDSLRKINNIINPEFEYITFEDIKNKTGNLYKDLSFESGGVNIETVKNLLDIPVTSSQVAYHSQVLKIRKENGELYSNVTFNKDSALQSPTVLLLFNNNYEYIRSYGNNSLPLSLNTDTFANTYYIILISYPTVAPNQSATYPLSTNNIYHVGVDQEFDNFTELLDDLSGNSEEKTIYLHEGTYNLYNEYGGDDYFNNLPELDASAWRQYCKIIPKNTHIIGLGNVVLNFPLPNNSNYNTVFSALNITDTCSVENIKINQTNGRYLIHIENGSTVKFSNISLNNIELNGASYNGISIGTGINEGSVYNLNNIVDNTTNSIGYYVHTNSLKGSFINIDNSIFENSINLQNWANSSGNTKNSKVNINNTYLDKLKIYGTTNIDSVSAYSIKTVGTNDYTIETQYTTNYDLIQKNIIE